MSLRTIFNSAFRFFKKKIWRLNIPASSPGVTIGTALAVLCPGNGDSTLKILWVSLAIGVATGALAAPTAVHAVSAQHIENTSEICIQETARVERTTGIPKALLGAISLAETGRWAPDRQESFAWPWTVMAEGRGRYFDTKAEAVAEVYALLDQGLTNIDVGCMQINLHYHGGAFADIEQAMDPTANIAYAGRYLSNLYGAAKSWTTAAGYYHSMTPDRSNAYRERVLALWNGMEKALSPTAHSISRRGSTGPLRTRVLPRTWCQSPLYRGPGSSSKYTSSGF